MSKNKKVKPGPGRSRPNVADSIDATAKRIAASLEKHRDSEEWDQEKIERLKSCDGKVGEIPISLIRTNQNIRKRIDENDPAFKALVESIRTHGILQPPIVTVVTNENGLSSILLVGGERRLRAAKVAGYAALNCMVRIFDNQSTRLTASVSENMNRRDLECLDIGHCFLSLSEQGYMYSEIQRLFDRDERTIGRYIKMAKWPDSVQNAIRDNQDKFTARYLLSLASRKISDEDLENEINVRISGEKTNEIKGNSGKELRLAKRLSNYFENKKLKQHEQDLIYAALIDLGFLSPDIGKGVPLRTVKGATAGIPAEAANAL
jgi:ParB family chromosome partitioning protein